MKHGTSTPRIHFVGIGGIGMSALARYFKSLKWAVSGSDLVKGQVTEMLQKDAIRAKIGHKKGHVSPTMDLVVYNRAILADNPELLAARRLGVPTLPYAKVLGELTRNYKTIAITGSHGKSTTTALAALALIRGGLDPTVFIGTNLKEFGGRNLRIGKSQYMVLEADDFGGAFLEYSPTIAIVTNIDREHLDFYKTFGALKTAFLQFLARTKLGGALILNRDDRVLYSLKTRITTLARKKNVRVIWYSTRDASAPQIKKSLKLPGEHNRSNAAAVYALGRLLKINEKKILSALGSYHGAWRRMEFRGTADLGGGANIGAKIKVFDDYAHHPTEIKATLNAFREKFPASPLICVFQPHQARRLHALFAEFTTAFDAADVTIILPLYKVSGRDKITKKDSKALVGAMEKRSPKKIIFYLAQPKSLKSFIKKILARTKYGRSPVLIMMGAGDIIEHTAAILT